MDFATDVLANILQRVQKPNDRRRLRLVCRHWCHTVDKRTATSLRRPAKKMLLATTERAYVLDDLSADPRGWEMPEWRPVHYYPRRNHVVGTCNGIVCMCDDLGGIVLYNPVTKDRLAVPRLPPRHQTSNARIWQRYSFTHDRATGRYMVVHLPWSYGGPVVVFTLGKASWQDIAMPEATYLRQEDGFVTIDSTMYWARWEYVMSFDLDGVRAPTVIPLPASRHDGTWRLTEVLGRLGIVFSRFSGKMDKMEVWVMEEPDASVEARWSRWYSVQIQRTPRHQPQWHDYQHLAWPHFAHGSNHILTLKWLSTGGGCALYQHMVTNDNTKNTKTPSGTVVINERNQGTMVACIKTDYDTFRRFDYVQTMEPLSVYKCW